jgi:putative hemolysin
MFVGNTIRNSWHLPLVWLTRPIKRNKQISFESIWDFSPNIQIHIENKKYVIKTAENGIDLEKVLRLRHKVYYEEILHKNALNSIDIDRFDHICDHLMVVEKSGGECVGTYRLNSSLFTTSFYSSTEFNIKNILLLIGNKLELGRACIEKDYRNTLSLAMLWKGLMEYVKRTHTRYIFGCSSIKVTKFDEVAPLYLYLRASYFSGDKYRVYPRRKHRFKNFSKYVKYRDRHIKNEPYFPDKCLFSLLKFYLRSGAEICGEPALDKDFMCTDFFTLLDITKMDKQIERKLIKEW